MTGGKDGSMTFRLPAELQAAFIAACKSRDRTAAQELRDFMRGYVKQHAQAELDLMTAKPRKGRKNANAK